jgi:hypothetical protein
MKALTKIGIGFLSLAAVALWFTSCSSEDVAQNGGGLNEKDQRVLLLSVNTGNLGTRSALTPDEKQINDMTVGIYDKSDNYRVVAKLASGADNTEASGTKTGTFTTASGVKVKVVTSTLQENDQVLVAVNRGDAFNSNPNPNSPTKFSEVTMDATTALQFKASSTDIDATKFPKFGKAILPAGDKSTFTATVSVKNLVSKVTLEDLSVSFTGPYANATFTPEEIFLLNVPDKLAFSDKGQASTSTYLNGTAIAKPDGSSVTKTAVLAKTITASALTGSSTASFTDTPILYTIPNSNSTSNKTILVIAGKFDKDGPTSAATEETVYYPLALNENYSTDLAGAAADGGTKSQTLAGKNYKCTVKIKTIGASNPWVTTGPQTAELTVNVADWDDADQTTTFE